MPLVYRAMLAEGDKPKIGPTAMTLGTRIPPDEHADVPVDGDGMVSPGTGGMSVAPAWRLLPSHRIPRRLRSKLPSAAGRNDLFIWRMGEGPFLPAPLGEALAFRPDPAKPDRHGLIEPARQMPLADYQAALAATQDQWKLDEE